jgi:phosphomethylpyrimidine synthase
MEITQQLREYAAQKGLHEEKGRETGMREKAEEFRRKGAEIYA